MARETRSTWAQRVEQWKRSGLTGEAFAGRYGIKEGTLRHWCWKLGHERRASEKTPTPPFVGVIADREVANAGPSSEIELWVEGVRVLVPTGFDEDTLRRLLRLVENR